MKPRTVLIAHRSAMVAEGIAAALARYPYIVPVGTATTAEEAARAGVLADAAAVDATMPGADELAVLLRSRGVRVAMIGDESEDAEDLRVSSNATVASLASALVPFGPGEELTSRALSPREHEILALAARGLAAKQVARQLGISPKTVEQHKTRIFAKLGVRNQTAAVSVAYGVRAFPSYRVSDEAATV